MNEPIKGWLRLRTLWACFILPPLLELIPLHRLAQWAGTVRGPAVGDAQALAGYVDWVLGRLPWPWRLTCLRRTIVLYHLLQGGAGDLRMVVGVRRGAGGGVEAHAWLARNGIPFLETETHTDMYAVIATVPELAREPD